MKLHDVRIVVENNYTYPNRADRVFRGGREEGAGGSFGNASGTSIEISQTYFLLCEFIRNVMQLYKEFAMFSAFFSPFFFYFYFFSFFFFLINLTARSLFRFDRNSTRCSGRNVGGIRLKIGTDKI